MEEKEKVEGAFHCQKLGEDGGEGKGWGKTTVK